MWRLIPNPANYNQRLNSNYLLMHFTRLSKKFRMPNIDLFASISNYKCKKYISWKIDPGSIAIDSFTISWKSTKFYAFPPFSQILRALRKIKKDEAEGIMVVPYWTHQAWFLLFQSLLISEPIIFTPNMNLLKFSNREPHLLWKSLSLVAGKLSAKHSRSKEYQQWLFKQV